MRTSGTLNRIQRLFNTRLKTKAWLGDLTYDLGTIMSDNRGKAQNMNASFSNLFTDEDVTNVPEPMTYHTGPGIETISMTVEAASRKPRDGHCTWPRWSA